jgi:SAM-dependent methyltransferase
VSASATRGFGESFDDVAEEYERGRPAWPEAALDVVDVPARADVLDLAAGTGKLTRLLVRRFRRVVAVEPLPAMRRLLGRIVPQADVLAGTAEAIPLLDGGIDAVYCGEAFHWFDWPRALDEIARVLRPRGVLVLLWNRPVEGAEGHSSYWPEEVRELLASHVVEHGRRYAATPGWRESFAGSQFEAPRYDVVPNDHVADRETMLARIASWSVFAAKAREERERLLAEIRSRLRDEHYAVRMETHVHWTRLAG